MAKASSKPASEPTRRQPGRAARDKPREIFTPSTEPAIKRIRPARVKKSNGQASTTDSRTLTTNNAISANNPPKRCSKARKLSLYMDDDALLASDTSDPLNRRKRWIPDRNVRTQPAQRPDGIPREVWSSYCTLDSHICAQIHHPKRTPVPVLGERKQPLTQPDGVPYAIWMAWQALDEHVYYESLSEEQIQALPMWDDVLKYEPDAPPKFKWKEGILVPLDPKSPPVASSGNAVMTDGALTSSPSGGPVGQVGVSPRRRSTIGEKLDGETVTIPEGSPYLEVVWY